MRPAGEISRALLQAVEQLATPERGVGLREMAERAGVQLEVARKTVCDMKRYGRLVMSGEHKVPGRNRPAALYDVPRQEAAANDAAAGFSLLVKAWG